MKEVFWSYSITWWSVCPGRATDLSFEFRTRIKGWQLTVRHHTPIMGWIVVRLPTTCFLKSNPIERVWKLLKKLRLHNRYLQNPNEVIKIVVKQFLLWMGENGTLKTLCYTEWWHTCGNTYCIMYNKLKKSREGLLKKGMYKERPADWFNMWIFYQ